MATESSNQWTTNHEGDPEFGERHFVDPGKWRPPEYVRDAFTVDARTQADESIEEALTTPAGIAKPNIEPGPSEYSWGRGLMVPLDLGPGPTQVEEMKAVQRTNPADPAASHLDRYSDWIRE